MEIRGVDYEARIPWLESVADPVDDAGRVRVPQRPGLGYAYDWEFVESNRVTG